MSGDDVQALVWSILAAAVILAAAGVLFVRTRRRRTVFISYRRSDSARFVADLAGRLRARFGRAFFRDVDSIPLGASFPSFIARRILFSDVVLVAIGPGWLTAVNERGRRLEQADDMTRQEIAMALASGARVIPLLIDGATMPLPDQLSADVRPLVLRNAVVAASGAMGELTAELVDAVLKAPVQRTPWMVLLAHAAIVTVMGGFAFSNGFFTAEISSALFIALPLFAATATVTLMHALGVARKHARCPHVPASTLWIPLGLAAVVVALVAMRASNFLINTPGKFLVGVGVIEMLLGVHTGAVLSSLFDGGEDALV